jgi:hypothetical protein
MYYEYMTTQYFVRFFFIHLKPRVESFWGVLMSGPFSRFLEIFYLLSPRTPFKNAFQHTFISVNNRGRAPSKYVNSHVGFYSFIPEVKQYGWS